MLCRALSVFVPSYELWFPLLRTLIGANTCFLGALGLEQESFLGKAGLHPSFSLSHMGWEGGDGTLLRLFQPLVVAVSFF